MRENMVNAARLMVVASWTTVGVLMAAAWIVTFVTGRWQVGLLIALTACAGSAVAATLQIRRYTVKVCRLINATAGLHSNGGGASTAPFGHVTKMR